VNRTSAIFAVCTLIDVFTDLKESKEKGKNDEDDND
jgi:hypothetical protein